MDPSPRSPRQSILSNWPQRLPAPSVLLLGIVSYIPLLFTRPGVIGADTKTYLYLDPARLLSRAAYMWDPNIGFGTVTHQNIGYLWPMGPYYWLFDTLGFPDWVAQRVWLGSIIFAAGMGVRFMCRQLRWHGSGVTVAMFAYALSPYLIDYAARISVILLPFAGLPWLIGFSAKALRRNDWRTPAVFALVTLTIGGVNATSLVLVMVGPILWFIFEVFVTRHVSLKHAIFVGLRITLFVFITSLWWMAGLMMQGRYGIPILRYTETYKTVAGASLSTEIFRGLGYWFFYGRDGLGVWTQASLSYIESLPGLVLSYLIPSVGFLAALTTRFAHRLFFAVMALLGMVISIGAYPWDNASPYGSVFRMFAQEGFGLSFRSTPRAVPLVALSLAVFLGAGIAALVRIKPNLRFGASAVALVLICANMAPLFQGLMVDRYLMRDEELPEYWLEATEYLDTRHTDTRAFEIPGIDFASYRWGNTVDPITPGLMDREYVARELIPYGTPASANLLNQVDQPFQSGRPVPEALAPLSRLMGVGDIIFRADLQHERYRTARPRIMSNLLNAAPGLGEPSTFGPITSTLPDGLLRLDDEVEYGTPRLTPHPSPVSVYPVEHMLPIARTVSGASPVAVSGDASGLVNMAAMGLLDPNRLHLYTATFASDHDQLRRFVTDSAADSSAELVVTDTNRKSPRRWGSVRENDGHTERPDEEALVPDPTDNRLDLFPDEDSTHQTTVEQVSKVTGEAQATVTASAYGNNVTYTHGERGVMAFDGDMKTAWKVGAFSPVHGEFLEIRSASPITTDRIDIALAYPLQNRHITEIDVVLDDEQTIRHVFGDAALNGGFESVTFPEQTFSTVQIVIRGTNVGEQITYKGISGVGIAEVRIDGLDPIDEIVHVPSDGIDAFGDQLDQSALTYLFHRQVVNPAEALNTDPELNMIRSFEVPTNRQFGLIGLARLNARLSDAELDQYLQLPGPAEGGVLATSSHRLDGNMNSRASLAVDGDPTTAYTSSMHPRPGITLRYEYGKAVTLDDLVMTVVDTSQYSLPRVVTVTVDGTSLGSFELIRGVEHDTGLVDLTAQTGTINGQVIEITVDELEERESTDWFAQLPLTLPFSIAELNLPTVPATNIALESTCIDGLVEVNGTSQAVRVFGTTAQLAAGELVPFAGCDVDGVGVSSGTQLLTTDRVNGLDVEYVALRSNEHAAAIFEHPYLASGGSNAAVDETATRQVPPLTAGEPATQTGPDTTVERLGRNTFAYTVNDATTPYWIVLGQSHSLGWEATLSDGTSLGEPVLVNGFATGWLIDPGTHGTSVVVTVDWTPQSVVWAALWLSAVGVLACIAIIIWNPRKATAAQPLPAMEPLFVLPHHVDGKALPVKTALGVVVGVTFAAVLVAGPFVGLAMVPLLLLGVLHQRGQLILRIAALLGAGAAVGYVILKQFRNNYPADFRWVEWFERSHYVMLFGMVAFTAAILIDTVRSTQPAEKDSDES